MTRSRILKLVSSFRGWLQRWHTKLTCMVLLDVLDPSIPAAMERGDIRENLCPRTPGSALPPALLVRLRGKILARAVPSRSGTILTGPASGTDPAKAVYSPVREGLQQRPSVFPGSLLRSWFGPPRSSPRGPQPPPWSVLPRGHRGLGSAPGRGLQNCHRPIFSYFPVGQRRTSALTGHDATAAAAAGGARRSVWVHPLTGPAAAPRG